MGQDREKDKNDSSEDKNEADFPTLSRIEPLEELVPFLKS